jgi:hypothetical protein
VAAAARDFLIGVAAGTASRHSVRVVEPTDVAREVETWFEAEGFKVHTRVTPEDVAVDLVGDVNPKVVLRGYGLGPDTVLAILAAEQRWLVEEEGRGSVLGDTYVDKARERLRRAMS